jgi:thioredoxin-like negative regulator of GroEL
MKEWNLEKWETFLAAKRTGVVYFYTPLCGTCQLASKMLRVIAEINPAEIGMMNLNFYPELGFNLEIESVPCLLLIKDGRISEKIYAFHSVPFLLEKINQLHLSGWELRHSQK